MIEVASGLWLHRDPQALEQRSERWRSLRSYNTDPYLDPFWYQSWWRAFGREEHNFLLFEQTEPEPAFVPCIVSQRVLSLMGNIYSHRQSVAIQGNAETFWSKLLPYLERYVDWDSVILPHLRREDPITNALRTCVQRTGRWLEMASEWERWAVIPEGQSWEEYLYSQGRDSRKKRRKVFSRLEDGGPYRFQEFTTVEEARAFVRLYFRILVRSWKPPELSRDFFRQICRHAAELGWFRSYVLFVEDEPVSFQLGFLVQGVYYCYKTAYHREYAALSPGIAVVDHALASAVACGAQKIDLLTGSDEYKSIWCNRSIQQVGFLTKKKFLVS